MGKRVISFKLSEGELKRAVGEIQRYRQELVQKLELLREKVAERLSEVARDGFDGAIVDDLITGEAKTAEVKVSVAVRDNSLVVIADGEDAVWVEFGAGVYHNGSATTGGCKVFAQGSARTPNHQSEHIGNSPHPKGSELGFTIGGYGKGMGKRTVWGYYENGELKLTHGTPAVMPMYNAVMAVCENLADIVKEVFG